MVDAAVAVELNERQIAFLVAMQDGHEYGSGRVFVLAYPDAPHRGRRDAGATRTLDAMEKLGVVTWRYPQGSDSRMWRITQAGKDLLRERGLLSAKRIGLAQRINGVPERDGYIYGLALRDDAGIVRVDVHRLIDGRTGPEIGRVEGVGWAGPEGIHAKAQALVDEAAAHA